MAAASRISTSVLLTCAAIGVATGVVGGIAGLITPLVIAGVPILYGLVLGAHVLPGIIAQQVLRLPWVALITHVMAALVASAFALPFAGRFLGTALLFGGIQEGVAALTRYRAWGAWRFFVSAAVIGVLVAAVVGVAANLATLPVWAQLVYMILSFLGPIGWTAAGLGVGTALRQAGVARRGRR
ncbi:ECF transporter S component [Microbacterium sp. P01]|uniref:ECF transporter S component n=1 Tax=unclassified Microbacterium TaxID=2609290 RepID=UPI00367306BD